jgi:arylsulfatase A-like enzyme
VPDGRGFRDVVTFADRVNDSPAQENYLASVGQWLTQQVVSEERSLGESEDAAGYVGLVSAVGAGDHFEAWLTERFLQWLETVGRREPFFAVWSVNRPHPPCVVPPEYAGRYQPDTMPLPPELPQGLKEWDPGVRIMEQRRRYSRMSSEQRRMALARYLSNVSFVDDCMGRILDGLRQSGLDRNTLVIFTSDHGDLMGEHGGYTKYNLYESAVRVPLIVRWPGVQHRGWVSDAAVELVDLFPTVLDAAGVQEPAYVAGRSLRPLIAGRSPAETGWRTETFTEFGCRLEWAVRGDQFKLIERPSGDSALYDLAADPLESVNRIHDPQCAEIRDHLRGQMLRRAMELASRYPCGHPAKAIHVADGIYDYCARTMSQRRTPPDYRGRIAVSQAEAAA